MTFDSFNENQTTLESKVSQNPNSPPPPSKEESETQTQNQTQVQSQFLIKECSSKNQSQSQPSPHVPKTYEGNKNSIFLSKKEKIISKKDSEGNETTLTIPGNTVGIVHCPTCEKNLMILKDNGFSIEAFLLYQTEDSSCKSPSDSFNNGTAVCCNNAITMEKTLNSSYMKKFKVRYTKDKYAENYLSIMPKKGCEDIIRFYSSTIRLDSTIRVEFKIKCEDRRSFFEEKLEETRGKTDATMIFGIIILAFALVLCIVSQIEASGIKTRNDNIMLGQLDLVGGFGIPFMHNDQHLTTNLIEMAELVHEMNSKIDQLDLKIQEEPWKGFQGINLGLGLVGFFLSIYNFIIIIHNGPN